MKSPVDRIQPSVTPTRAPRSLKDPGQPGGGFIGDILAAVREHRCHLLP